MQLVQASEAAIHARDAITYEAWGGGLPLELYRTMAQRLRSHDWARDTAGVWLLQEGADVLCSCEVYRMESRLPDGAPGHAYAVASVYTAPAFRRRGHAADLLERLARHLAAEDPRAQALILFSDVPKVIYEKAGFVARPAWTLGFPSLPGDPLEGGAQLIQEEGVPEAFPGLMAPVEGFTVLPVAAQVDWQLEQERIFSTLLERPRPHACGARFGEAAAVWCADYVKGRLCVLLVNAPRPEEASGLLSCARRTANAAGLGKTVLWRSGEEGPWAHAPREDRHAMLDSVPMIRPLAPGCIPGDWGWIPKAVWV